MPSQTLLRGLLAVRTAERSTTVLLGPTLQPSHQVPSPGEGQQPADAGGRRVTAVSQRPPASCTAPRAEARTWTVASTPRAGPSGTTAASPARVRHAAAVVAVATSRPAAAALLPSSPTVVLTMAGTALGEAATAVLTSPAPVVTPPEGPPSA